MVVNNPLTRPYFLGRVGGIGGVPLDFHERYKFGKGGWRNISIIRLSRKTKIM